MRIPLYASEPLARLDAVRARLSGAEVSCQVVAARDPVGEEWGLSPGEVDLLIEHGDLAAAQAALEGFEPAPVAGRVAPAGTTVLRPAGDGPGWRDLLGRGAAGGLRVLRVFPLAGSERQRGWEAERYPSRDVLDGARASLRRWEHLTGLVPAIVALERSEREPALELVLELPSGAARFLPDLSEPLSAGAALRAHRVLSRMVDLEGEPLVLHPEGLLVRADGRLTWADAGAPILLAISGGASRDTPSWRARDVLRRLLGAAPDVDPEASLRAALDAAGLCQKCGAALQDTPRCHACRVG